MCLFPDLTDKKVFDIGCGSGHSLQWWATRGPLNFGDWIFPSGSLKTQRTILPKTDIRPNCSVRRWKTTPAGRPAIEDGGHPLTLYNRRLSDYIHALAGTGLTVVRVVEETDKDTLERDFGFTSQYYAPCKAKRFPLSIVVKARKI